MLITWNVNILCYPRGGMCIPIGVEMVFSVPDLDWM